MTPRRGLAVCLLLLSACLGCTREQARQLAKGAPCKVLLVGIDGASYTIIDRFVATHRLPATKRLMDQGARVAMTSEEPLRSPAIWTTILTGRSRADHGVDSFYIVTGPGTKRLPRAGDRLVPALWNIADAAGLEAGFAAFWATWPAEPIRGFMLSDRLVDSKFAHWFDRPSGSRLAWPPSLTPRLAGLRLRPDFPPLDAIAAIAPLNDEELTRLSNSQYPVYGHWLSVLKYSLTRQLSYERMLLSLFLDRQPDVAGVYLSACDTISHTFWHFYEPEKFKAKVDPDSVKRLKGVIPAIYEHNDAYLGLLLDRIDPSTTVIVVSDHGFKASRMVPRRKEMCGFSKWFRKARNQGRGIAIGQSGMHDRNAVFIASGGPIRQGAKTTGTIYDVTPTVLALLDLPVARNMPGRVLTEIIEPDWLHAHPVKTIDSYDTRIPCAKGLAAARAGEGRMRLLKALGYVE